MAGRAAAATSRTLPIPACRRPQPACRATASPPALCALIAGATGAAAGPARRLNAYLLYAVLYLGIFVVGGLVWGLAGDAFLMPALLTGIAVWLIWSFVVYGESCSPGKKFMGLRVVDICTGAPLSRSMMALRELVIKWLLFRTISSMLPLGIFPIIADLWLLWG